MVFPQGPQHYLNIVEKPCSFVEQQLQLHFKAMCREFNLIFGPFSAIIYLLGMEPSLEVPTKALSLYIDIDFFSQRSDTCL